MVKDPNCKNKYWKMHELDEIVFNEIKKLAIDPEYIHTLKNAKNDNQVELNKIEILKKEIANIDDQISRFMDLYGIGKFTIDQVSSKVDPLNAQRLGLVNELESLNADADTMSEEETRELVKSFADILERGDLNEIRLAIESLLYYIEIDEDDVYIHWKFI